MYRNILDKYLSKKKFIMSLFDNLYRAMLNDGGISSDISDDLNSIVSVNLALERDDFQMLPCNCTGIESVMNEARDRIMERFVAGADVEKPATIDLFKSNKTVSTQQIDDLTIKITQNKASFSTKELSLWEKIKADKDTKFDVKCEHILQDNVRVFSLRGEYTSAGLDTPRFTRGNRLGAYTLPLKSGGEIKGFPLIDGEADGVNFNDILRRWYSSERSGEGKIEPIDLIFSPANQQLRIQITVQQRYNVRMENYDSTFSTGIGWTNVGWSRNNQIAIVLCRWVKGMPNGSNPIFIDTGYTLEYNRIGSNAYYYWLNPMNYLIETPLMTEESYHFLMLMRRDSSGGLHFLPHLQDGNDSTGVRFDGQAESPNSMRIKINGVAGSKALIDGVDCVTIQKATLQVLKQVEPKADIMWDIDLMKLKQDIKFTELLVNPAAFDLQVKAEAKNTLRCSIFDLLKTLDINYCIGIEELEGNIIRIADRRKILRIGKNNEDSIDPVDGYSDLQIEIDIQRLFNKIKVGSDKGVNKDTEGRQDFHGLTEWSIPKTRDKDQILDLVHPYYVNPLGISNYLVERNTKEDAKDNPKDMDIFVFCGWRKTDNGAFYIYKNSSSTQFPRPNLVGYKTIPLLDELSTEVYNVPISPIRTLFRHANFIRGILEFFRNPPVYKKEGTQVTQDFQAFTQCVFENKEITEKPGTVSFSNDDEVNQFGTAKAFTKPIKISMQTDLTFHNKLKFENRNNPLLIETDMLETNPELFHPAQKGLLIAPMGVSFNLCENAISEVSGQWLTGETEYYYLKNICKPNILQQ